MTSLSAAGSNGRPDSSVTRTLSSLFGVAAASSPRKVVPRRRRDVEEISSDLDQPGGMQPESSTSKHTEVPTPDSRNRRGSVARVAGSSESIPAAAPMRRAPSSRFRPVQVRDRRFIHIFLLAAATRAPTGQMLIDFVSECSDGVFVLSTGVVYRELHMLEKERLITVRRGSRQRRYTLTDLGERVLAARRREWETFSHGVDRLLEEADDGDRRGE
jgi:DNA-binding PadR family transcriptional regulator